MGNDGISSNHYDNLPPPKPSAKQLRCSGISKKSNVIRLNMVPFSNTLIPDLVDISVSYHMFAVMIHYILIIWLTNKVNISMFI
jgi:hypothetical protein